MVDILTLDGFFGSKFHILPPRWLPNSVIAIDGKVLRRSFDKASGKSPLHMVSAWGCDQRLVLAQVATDAKSNEITAVPKLLSLLSLKPLRSRVIRGRCMTMSASSSTTH